ncbi:ecotin family protein [Lignipirellula cremea]|uniref:Ecotin n=1 Tax=Lignipirellula cremea TaxID=2528010 RepID=A0A518DM67_9BACT|nr:ecotin family protein [Lignipirellula cremea]QDU92912.1 Ecotin precursor [Lignipirellula cremea]
MQRLPIFLAGFFVLLGVSTAVAQQDNLKAFPPAGEGMVRYVIRLPHKERGEEDDFQVELLVGKKVMTDGVNHVMLGGEVAAKPLEGWGFTYYELKKFGPLASTLIAPPPGTPQVQKFIAVPSQLIRYNSRIPLVVYVPADAEVRYRIWKAGPAASAEKG